MQRKRSEDDKLQVRIATRICEQVRNEWRLVNDTLHQRITAVEGQGQRSSQERESLARALEQKFGDDFRCAYSDVITTIHGLAEQGLEHAQELSKVREDDGILRTRLDQVFDGEVESALSKAIERIHNETPSAIEQVGESAREGVDALKSNLDRIFRGDVESWLSKAIVEIKAQAQLARKGRPAQPTHLNVAGAPDDGSEASDSDRLPEPKYGGPLGPSTRQPWNLGTISSTHINRSSSPSLAPEASGPRGAKRRRNNRIGPAIKGYRRCADTLNGGDCTALSERKSGEAEDAVRWRCKEHNRCRSWRGGVDLLVVRR